MQDRSSVKSANMERIAKALEGKLKASGGLSPRPNRAAHLAKYKWKKGQSGCDAAKWKPGLVTYGMTKV